MFKKIYELVEMLKKGATHQMPRELASYMMNVYGYQDLYSKTNCSNIIHVTPDLSVRLLFVEDKEICTSINMKYYYDHTRDNLIFSVRKKFNSCTFKEKVMTICRIVVTILSKIYTDKDDISELTKFYSQLVFCVLAFKEDKRDEIVEIITKPFAGKSQELVDDFKYMAKAIYKMKDSRGVSSTLYSLYNCGYLIFLSNEIDKKVVEENNREEVKND